MLKFKLPRQLRSLLVSSSSHNPCYGPRIALLLFVQDKTYTSTPDANSTNLGLVEYLTNTLKFPKSKAVAVSRRFPSIISSEKAEAVVRFFKTLGSSDAQIQSCLQLRPSIFFMDVEKILKPKITFFQELGICGPQLVMIISRNPCILSSSLDRKLKPSIGVIKEALEFNGINNSNDNINNHLFRILSRYSWNICETSRLRANLAYLRKCGVVGTQLNRLLLYEPRIFSLPDGHLKLLVSRAIEMGFAMGSRMLVYGITGLYCNSAENVSRKIEFLQGFGFSRDEFIELIMKAPLLLNASTEKLGRGIEFYLHTLMLDKSSLLRAPKLLSISMEKRVIPRCKLLETLKSRSLLKEEPNYVTYLLLSNTRFAERYILRFAYDAKLLQVANEYNLLASPKG